MAKKRPEILMKAIEELLSRAQASIAGFTQRDLLDDIGIHSPSLWSAWKIGKARPTVEHCIELALFEEERLFEKDSPKKLQLWLQLADRTGELNGQTKDLLEGGRRSRALRTTDRVRRKVLEQLEVRGAQWRHWAEACWHAQEAAEVLVSEWLAQPGTGHVFHLHHWDAATSVDVLKSEFMVRYYERLLRMTENGKPKVTFNILVLPKPGIKPQSDEDVDTKSALTGLSRTLFAGGMRLPLIFLPRKDERSRLANQLDYLGDLWIFHGEESSFGILLREPTSLIRRMKAIAENIPESKPLLVRFSVATTRLSPEEYVPLLKRRGLTMAFADSVPEINEKTQWEKWMVPQDTHRDHEAHRRSI